MNDFRENDYQPLRSDFVFIGRILRPHGTKGEVVMFPFGAEPAQLEKVVTKEFFLIPPQGKKSQQLVLQTIRFHKGMALLKFKGINSVENAEKLRNAEVFISEKDRPQLEEGEYYFDQLIGLRVIDADSGEQLGTVSAIVYGTSCENLEINVAGRCILLPLAEQFISEINLAQGYLTVQLPQGLLDL